MLRGGLSRRRPVGCYFDHFTAMMHVYQLETAADDSGPLEQGPHLLRGRVGGNIKILRVQPKNPVSHAAADQVAVIAVLLQGFAHQHCAVRNFVQVDTQR